MELKHLTDMILLKDTFEYAKKEKYFSALVIRHIAEVRRRRAYVQLGYRSIFEFCTQGLKFSESQSMRRLEAAKLMEEVPGVMKKLERGQLNLTQLSCLAPLFQRVPHTLQQKGRVIEQIMGMSTRDIQRLVFEKLGNEKRGQEKIKVVNSTETELTIVLDQESFAMLKELKERMAHEGVKNYSTMIKKVCAKELLQRREKFLLKKDRRPEALATEEKRKYGFAGDGAESESFAIAPASTPFAVSTSTITSTSTSTSALISRPTSAPTIMSSKKLASSPTPPSAPKVKSASSTISRHIPHPIKREVWIRARGSCEYLCQKSPSAPKVKCSSTYALEFHHIHPYSMEHQHHLSNLQLLCKDHHQRLTYQFMKKIVENNVKKKMITRV